MSNLKIEYVKNYDLWHAVLGGKKGGGEDGEVHLGFWRYRTKHHENGGDPVAIWEDNGQVFCQIGKRVVDHHDVFNVGDGKDKRNLAEFFNRVRERPVPEDVYWARMDTGNWPDLHEAVTAQLEENRERIGGNNPPPDDSFEVLDEQIKALVAQVEALLKGGAAKTKEDADIAADLATALGKLYQKADNAKDEEKAPHWKKCVEIENKWRPLRTAAEIYKKVKEVVILPWQAEADRQRLAKLAAERAEAARLANEAAAAKKRAEDEAQRLADGAARASATGEEVDEKANAAAIEEAARQADELTEQAATAQHQADQTAKNTVKVGGNRGRAIGLKPVLVVTCIDRKLASGALKENGQFLKQVDALIEGIARDLKTITGQELPGVKYEIEQRSV